MSNESLAGLVPRKVVDRIALGAFALFFVFFLIFLLTAQSSRKAPVATTTTTTSQQVVSGPHGLIHRTQSVQKVTSDAAPPVWESLLGNRQTIFLICAAALLTAYLLAAITQRILLGRYAIGIGPLSVPDLITQQEVSDAVAEALSSAEGAQAPQSQPEPGAPAPEPGAPAPEPGIQAQKPTSDVGAAPAWVSVSDPNLALAGWRIDLERELRRLAEEFHFPGNVQRFTRRIVSALSDRGIIPHVLANSLQDLLTLANQGVHGARVDEGVIPVLRTDGLQLVQSLREIHG